MNEHTKEPWAVAPSHDGGQHIANVDGIVVIYQNQKNMDRIVACVNACAGINPEAVPDALEALKECAKELHAARMYEAQRWSDDFDRRKQHADSSPALIAARAALAKAGVTA